MTPAHQRRVRESHPEVAFARLAGAPLRFAKLAQEGRADRRRLLAAAFPGLAIQHVRGAKEDDVLDALALLWVARRIARGAAHSLPAAGPQLDRRGLRCEITT